MRSRIDERLWSHGFIHIYQLIALEGLGEAVHWDHAAKMQVLFMRAQ